MIKKYNNEYDEEIIILILIMIVINVKMVRMRIMH